MSKLATFYLTILFSLVRMCGVACANELPFLAPASSGDVKQIAPMVLEVEELDVVGIETVQPLAPTTPVSIEQIVSIASKVGEADVSGIETVQLDTDYISDVSGIETVQLDTDYISDVSGIETVQLDTDYISDVSGIETVQLEAEYITKRFFTEYLWFDDLPEVNSSSYLGSLRQRISNLLDQGELEKAYELYEDYRKWVY